VDGFEVAFGMSRTLKYSFAMTSSLKYDLTGPHCYPRNHHQCEREHVAEFEGEGSFETFPPSHVCEKLL